MNGYEAVKLVYKYFPNVDETMANKILWSCTGWPSFFENIDVDLEKQLKDISIRSAQDPKTAMGIADADLTRWCNEFELKHPDVDWIVNKIDNDDLSFDKKEVEKYASYYKLKQIVTINNLKLTETDTHYLVSK